MLFKAKYNKNIQNTIKTFVTKMCLKIIAEPITSIPGGPELYIDMGSTVNLTCIVKHLPDPPLTVHWTHNNEVNNTKIFLFTF